MPKNRQAAQTEILQWVDKIDTSGRSGHELRGMWSKLDDAGFERFMVAIEEGRNYIPFLMPNHEKAGITVENNLRVAAEMNYQFFQRIWMTDPSTGMEFLTPKRFLVYHLPVRRQIQTLQNKISIPEDNKHVDELTDQPTGVSKGSAASFPEILVMRSKGHDAAILELIKYRGGDLKGMMQMDRQILQTGGASLAALDKLGTRVKATETLSTLLTTAHLENNF